MGRRAAAGSKDLCGRVDIVFILRAGDGGRCLGRSFHALRRRQKLKQEYAHLIWASRPTRRLLSEIAVEEDDDAEARESRAGRHRAAVQEVHEQLPHPG